MENKASYAAPKLPLAQGLLTHWRTPRHLYNIPALILSWLRAIPQRILSGYLKHRHFSTYKPSPVTPAPAPLPTGTPVASWMRAEFLLRMSRKEEEP